MGALLGYILVAALMLLLLLAVVSLLRSFLLSIRTGRGVEPPTRIVALPPPAPVKPSGGVTVTATLALTWCAAHVVTIVIWAATALAVPRTFPAVMVAVYVFAAAVLTGAGGALLAATRAVGRRVVAWGEFLLGVASVLATAISLMLPGYEDAPTLLRDWAYWLAAGFAAHLVIDVIIGTAAQHAGKSPSSVDDTQEADSSAAS